MNTFQTILIWLCRIAGVLIAAWTAFEVFEAWSDGHSPPGAPWSVLTMAGLALMLGTTPRVEDRRYAGARVALSLAVILFAALWFFRG